MRIANHSLGEAHVSQLKEHPRNPNRGNVGVIKESIDANGFFGVVVAQVGTGYVLAGNHRYRAAVEAGAETIPVAWVDCDDEQALRILLVDNRAAELGHRDGEALAGLLQELADAGSLAGTGYSAQDLDALFEGLTPAMRAENPEEVDPGAGQELVGKWGVEPGQWWVLGEHWLYVGSCEDVPWPVEADLFWDPPWDAPPARPVVSGGVLAFSDGGRFGGVVNGLGAPAWVFVWDCVTSWYTPNRPLRRAKHCLWYGDLAHYDPDGAHYGDAGEAREVKNTRGSYEFVPDPRGKHLSDVFQQSITRLHSEGTHRHSKPLDWVRLLIGDCLRGDLLLDPCAGSGVSLIACQQLGRRCVASEVDPLYAATIIEGLALMGLEPRRSDGPPQ